MAICTCAAYFMALTPFWSSLFAGRHLPPLIALNEGEHDELLQISWLILQVVLTGGACIPV
jgi:hypothetical protein